MYKLMVLVFAFVSFAALPAQGQEKEAILSIPPDWKSEEFTFPLGFAPEIEFDGVEILRLSPKWSDIKSPQFWTGMYVWYGSNDTALTVDKLTESMEFYYNGLMGAVSSNDTTATSPPDPALSLFMRDGDAFRGKIKVRDAFFTKELITLHFRVRESFCPETGKKLISFKFSPKRFEDPHWEIFEEVKVKIACE